MRCVLLFLATLALSFCGAEEHTFMPCEPGDRSEATAVGDGSTLGAYLDDQPQRETAKTPLTKATFPQRNGLATDASLQRAFDKALVVVRAEDDPIERTEQLLRLGMARTRQGKRDEARAILGEALRAAEAIQPNANYAIPHPIIRIAHAQAESGDRIAAHQTFQSAIRVVAEENEQKQFQNWPNLIKFQLETEPRASMIDSLKAYRQFVERDKRQPMETLISLDAALSENLPDVLRKIPADKRCTALLAIIPRFGPDERERMRPVLAEARKAIDDAVEERHTRPFRLHSLASQEARLGFFAEALTTVEAIVPSDANLQHEPEESIGRFQKATAFLEIAERQCRAGDLQGARLTTKKALEIAQAIKDEKHQAFPLTRVIKLLIRVGDLEKALQVVDWLGRPDDTMSFLREIALVETKQGAQAQERAKLLWARAMDCARLSREPVIAKAEIQAEMGDLMSALDTVRAIPAAAKRQSAMSRVALTLAAIGDVRGALSVVEGMSPGTVKDQAFVGIACANPAP